jgi:predicted RND superfamily exporter protein
METNSVRHSSVGRPLRLEMYREWFMALVALGLLIVAGLVAVNNVSLKADLERKDSGLYRSATEMQNGVKRFIDYFYSINSGTVRPDQFRAINMLADESMQQQRVRYISEKDIVRRAERSKGRSEIDWMRSTVTAIGEGEVEHSVVYECKVVLVTRFGKTESRHKMDVVVTVIPVQKTDNNTEGVGVVAFSDLAYDPFAKGVQQ